MRFSKTVLSDGGPACVASSAGRDNFAVNMGRRYGGDPASGWIGVLFLVGAVGLILFLAAALLSAPAGVFAVGLLLFLVGIPPSFTWAYRDSRRQGRTTWRSLRSGVAASLDWLFLLPP